MAFLKRQTGPMRAGFRPRVPLSARLEHWLEAERTQLPLWLPVGGVAGIAAWFWLPGRAGWAGFLLLAVALALPGLAFGRGGRLGRAVALFSLAAGLGCGLIWWKAERAGGATLAHAEVVRFTARIERVEPLPARCSRSRPDSGAA